MCTKGGRGTAKHVKSTARSESVNAVKATGKSRDKTKSANGIQKSDKPNMSAAADGLIYAHRLQMGGLRWRVSQVVPPEPLEVAVMTPAVERLAKRIMRPAAEGNIAQVMSLIDDRPENCRDKDGYELARLVNWLYMPPASSEYLSWLKASPRRKQLLKLVTLPDRREYWNGKTVQTIQEIIAHNFELVWDFQLDRLQAIYAAVPIEDYREAAVKMWRHSGISESPGSTRRRFSDVMHKLNDQQLLRYWRLMDWLHRGHSSWPPLPIFSTGVLEAERLATFRAFELGEAKDGDLAYMLSTTPHQNLSNRIKDAPEEVKRRRPEFLRVNQSLIQDYIAAEYLRISDIAGDTTDRIYDIKCLVGLDYLFAFLEQLDSQGFVQQSHRDHIRLTRSAVRSHLIRVTMPETEGVGTRPTGNKPPGIRKPATSALNDFAKRVTPLRHNGLSDTRLLELAFHAPQWAWYVEHALGLEGLAETVFWCHCSLTPSRGPTRALESDGYVTIAAASVAHREHNRGDGDVCTEDSITTRALDLMLLAFTGQRTVLNESEDGYKIRELPENVSLDWADKIRSEVPSDRWNLFLTAMKVAGPPSDIQEFLHGIGETGSTKPRKVDRPDIKKVLFDVEFKHRNAAVEQLSKVPLAQGADRDVDLAERVRVLTVFDQFYARKLERMFDEDSADSSIIAAKAFNDLAILAGLPSEEQLYWLASCRFLERIDNLGPGGRITEGQISVTLRIDDSASPVIDILKNNKPVRSIPKEVQQLPSMKELETLRAEIDRISGEIRGRFQSFGMIEGAKYVVGDLMKYKHSPIIKTICKNQVFIKKPGVSRKKIPLMGYLMLDESCYLVDLQGEQQLLSPKDSVRIAHPVDFEATGKWPAWKELVSSQQRVEPFQQVTRELFVPTEEEIQQARAAGPLPDRSRYFLKDAEEDGEKYGVRRFADHPVHWSQIDTILENQGWVKPIGGIYMRHWRDCVAVAIVKIRADKKQATSSTAVESVLFYRTDSKSKPIQICPLDQVPPRYFSETMRRISMAVTAASV